MIIRRLALGIISASIALGYGASVAFAGSGNPNGTGQPSVECSDDPALRVPGFNTGGFDTAEGVYANEDATGGLASENGHVASQYDVACYHFTNRP
jgi:hypothetical protein